MKSMIGPLGLELTLNSRKMSLKKYLGIGLCALFLLIACSEEEDNGVLTFEAPSVDLSLESGEFRIGQTIRVDVSLEASALFRNFVVQRGSSIIDQINYPDRTEGEDNYSLEFFITENLLGTTQTFTFTVTDTFGETDSAAFTATISEVAPAFTIEDVELNGTEFKQVTGRINFDETFEEYFKYNKCK